MEKECYIFTEAFNCGKILSVCLESFHRHHNKKVHIIGTTKDFEDAGPIINHKNNVLINWDNNEDARNKWSIGHQGTALAFASCMNGTLNTSNRVIHFDADCFFIAECIDGIIELFDKGFSVIGTPRPYKNNLSGIKGLDGIPDCVSTYMMGINTDSIPKGIPFDDFIMMCGGWRSYTGQRCLDFFDPVVHAIIANGGNVHFLDTVKYGGMSLDGDKNNGIDSNLNFDCGTHIAHFGGVGSGKAVSDNLSEPPKGYADWSYYRWNFYSHLFFGTDIDNTMPTVYSARDDHNGKRWCNGPADESIITSVRKDIGDTNQKFGSEINIIFDQEIRRFFENGGDSIRLNCNLNNDSIVIDAGGYEGKFARDVYNKYGSRVFVYEPFKDFAKKCESLNFGIENVKVYPLGISDFTGPIKLYVQGDSTSTNDITDDCIECNMITLDDVMKNNNIEVIDLLKLNIEGDEYRLLEDIISKDLLCKIKTLHIQFHRNVQDFEERRKFITSKLEETHSLEWQYDWVWESWKIK